ncbi:MAG: DUF4412 domain-containing protein [Verrucomicrobiae bacterium]|nr:DUF4412 domain-containing protein [Verrucomicrobiae bacterium]
MRRAGSRWIASFFLLWMASPLHADLTLSEKLQPAGGAGPQRLGLEIAQGKVRFDSGEVSSIIRTDRKLTYSLLHAEHSYMTLPHDRPVAAAADFPAADSVEKTGHIQTLQGLVCREVRIAQPDGTTLVAWVSLDPPARRAVEMLRQCRQDGLSGFIDGLGCLWPAEKGGAPGLALRCVLLDAAGKPTVQVDVDKLSFDSIPDEQFEPPPAYRQAAK